MLEKAAHYFERFFVLLFLAGIASVFAFLDSTYLEKAVKVAQFVFAISMPLIAWNALKTAKNQWAIAKNKETAEERDRKAQADLELIESKKLGFKKELIGSRPKTPLEVLPIFIRWERELGIVNSSQVLEDYGTYIEEIRLDHKKRAPFFKELFEAFRRSENPNAQKIEDMNLYLKTMLYI